MVDYLFDAGAEYVPEDHKTIIDILTWSTSEIFKRGETWPSSCPTYWIVSQPSDEY